jgi:hypothetical protein
MRAQPVRAAVTPEKPGTAGTAKGGNRTGRSLSLMRMRQRGSFFCPRCTGNLFLSFLYLYLQHPSCRTDDSSPLRLRLARMPQQPVSFLHILFMLFLVSLRIVALGAQHGLVSSNGTLLRQRPKLVACPSSPSSTHTTSVICHGLLSFSPHRPYLIHPCVERGYFSLLIRSIPRVCSVTD